MLLSVSISIYNKYLSGRNLLFAVGCPPFIFISNHQRIRSALTYKRKALPKSYFPDFLRAHARKPLLADFREAIGAIIFAGGDNDEVERYALCNEFLEPT